MKHILVVDDDSIDQFLVERVVGKHRSDVQVSCVCDGIDALNFLEVPRATVDAILLDINMPRMNGHDFLGKYAVTHAAKVPVFLMLTSADQIIDKQLAARYPFVLDFFEKPLTADKLLRIENLTYRFNQLAA